MQKLSVDVIIPTYLPDEKLNKIMEKLQKQTYPVNKIILVNTEENGLRKHDFSKYENVEIHHVSRSKFNHGITRNYATSLSKADIVVFMTQDAVPTGKHMIQELIRPFEDEDVYVTYGRQLPRNHCEASEVFTRQFNYPDHDIVKTKDDLSKLGIKTFFSSDVCAAYRREKHAELGGFPNTLFNEDSIFASKVISCGKKVYYASKAMVVHSHNYTCMQQFRRNFDIGVSHEQFSELFSTVVSENEGIRLVNQTIMHLIKTRKFCKIPIMIIKSGFKYVGYRLGKAYKKLPRWIILKCTLNPYYWKQSDALQKRRAG